jgi:hypothetical protein
VRSLARVHRSNPHRSSRVRVVSASCQLEDEHLRAPPLATDVASNGSCRSRDSASLAASDDRTGVPISSFHSRTIAGHVAANIRGMGLLDSGGATDLTQDWNVADIESIVLAQSNGFPVQVTLMQVREYRVPPSRQLVRTPAPLALRCAAQRRVDCGWPQSLWSSHLIPAGIPPSTTTVWPVTVSARQNATTCSAMS